MRGEGKGEEREKRMGKCVRLSNTKIFKSIFPILPSIPFSPLMD